MKANTTPSDGDVNDKTSTTHSVVFNFSTPQIDLGLPALTQTEL